MNSQTASFASRSFTSLAGRATRAQFSPVLRHATHDAFVRRSAANRVEPSSLGAVQFVDDTMNELTRSTSDRWWDPHLIDRLRSPLTRYHD